MANTHFKLGMYLPELRLPFDEALVKAKEIGVEYIWFNHLSDQTPINQMNDNEIDRMGKLVSQHGLEIFLIGAGNPFKTIHLTNLPLKTMSDHPVFQKELKDLIRSMQIASRLGVSTVNAFSFAWPGEYTAGKPTWPMRWLTRGGIISNREMDKLIKAFSMVVVEAERYNIDVALSMMCWNYTNTTGNFRRLVDQLGSKRIKVMWGPADNINCGEWDVATTGFHNIQPYLHGLHLKDLHIIDGQQLQFEYRPIGDGDVDYLTVLRQLRNHNCATVLSVATHFLPDTGSPEDAMRINYTNLLSLIQEI